MIKNKRKRLFQTAMKKVTTTFVYLDVPLVIHKILPGCYIASKVLRCNVFCLPEGCPPSLQEASDNPEHDVAEEQMVS